MVDLGGQRAEQVELVRLGRPSDRELADDMMAAISESRKDARRQYYIVMNDRDSLPPPLADEMRRQRSNRTTDGDLLSSEKAE